MLPDLHTNFHPQCSKHVLNFENRHPDQGRHDFEGPYQDRKLVVDGSSSDEDPKPSLTFSLDEPCVSLLQNCAKGYPQNLLGASVAVYALQALSIRHHLPQLLEKVLDEWS